MPNFYSDRDPLHIADVFPGWILSADVSSVTSVGGGSKGLMSADVMARISRGWPMPPFTCDDPLADWDSVATPGYVLHVTLEDAVDRTMKFRLPAAGADETRIAYMDQLALPADAGKLWSEAKALRDCRLIVIDPWMSAATSTVSFNQQLRVNLLNPLLHSARETGIGVWLLNHFTKGTNGGRLGANSTKSLTDYVAGSKGFTDTLRMNTVVVESAADPDVKEWKTLKANGGGCDPLRYKIAASMPNDPDAHIEWEMPPLNMADPRVFARIQERVAQELAAAPGPVSPQYLTMQCGVPFALVLRALRNLEQSGAVAKRRGAYETKTAISPARAAAVPELEAAKPDWAALPIGARLQALIDGQG